MTFDNTPGVGGVRTSAKVAEAWRADVVLFARLAGFEPDEPQIRVLRSVAQRGILNCTRQWGKSTVTAAKALHHVTG
jgi:hypothetical protein